MNGRIERVVAPNRLYLNMVRRTHAFQKEKDCVLLMNGHLHVWDRTVGDIHMVRRMSSMPAQHMILHSEYRVANRSAEVFLVYMICPAILPNGPIQNRSRIVSFTT